MSTSFLDRYLDLHSPIHRLDARVKFVLTLGLIVAIGLLPAGGWGGLVICAGVIWAVALRAQISLRLLLSRALVALPFAAVALTLLFSRPGQPLFQLPLGVTTLTATDVGLIAFVTVVLKSWVSVQAALLLTMTTHFTDLLQALKDLRLPAVLVAILSFAYRYLFVLIDEGQRMLRARECRSAEAAGRRSGGSLRWRAAVVGRMVGTLFLRSYERSERIYVAMLSRGYDGALRTIQAKPLSPTEQGIMIIGLSICAAIVLGAYVF
jgi:cobalt/nickel transport system permease protein